MIKQILLLLFGTFIICGFITSCFSIKQTNTENEVTELNSIKFKFDLSLYTKMFLQELEREKAVKNYDNYVPSKKLIEKYNLKKLNGIYTISGFIKINNEFNKNDLVQLNIKANSKIGEIMTVIIPLNSIEMFLKINGIIYFEISRKVELRNK